MLPGDDYKSILVAFDDEDGVSVNSEYIDDDRLSLFLTAGKPIHYEKMFTSDKRPVRAVYWAISESKGWSERYEITL